jgi:hypothetical protein
MRLLTVSPVKALLAGAILALATAIAYAPEAAAQSSTCSADSKSIAQLAQENGYRYSDPCASQSAFAPPVQQQPATTSSPPAYDPVTVTIVKALSKGNAFAAAILAAPSLRQQMQAASAAHQSAQIQFKSVAAGTGIRVDGTVVYFSESFLAEQAKNHLFDVVHDHEIYPNSLVFVLGHLAYHLAHPGPDTKSFLPSNFNGGDVTQPALQFINASMADEAQCYFQGWNDMIEAAVGENGSPLTQQQIGDLLLNFRYRGPFLMAMGLPRTTTALTTDDRLVLQPSGAIVPTDQNIKAMAAALRNVSVPDFETGGIR